MATVDHDRLRLVVKQKFHRFLRQSGGIGEPGHAAVGALQQIAKSQLRMVERQRRHPQALEFKDHKRLESMAKVEKAGMFKEIVAPGFIWRAVNRNGRPHPPAQRKQPLDMIHVVMGE